MYLTLDIGNTFVKAVRFDAHDAPTPVPLPTGALPGGATADDALFSALFTAHPDARLACASVVPARTAAARAAAERAGRALFCVTAGADLPLHIAYETPETLGADRIAAAVGGWTAPERAAGRGVVVVDAGTAVTYEVVDADGAYLGGAIAPGPGLLLRSLVAGTAQLPDVPLDVAPDPIGRSTRAALQSGVLHGFVDAARGMLARIADRLDAPPTLFVTGGWGGRLADALGRPEAFHPYLVHRGILTIARRNES